jgi:RHS repeat-associated protein
MPTARTALALLIALGAATHSATGAPESGEPIAVDPGLSTGTWADSVEIETAPAPNNSQPAISLVADQHVVDGDVGSGWRLSVGSSITRHSLTGGSPNFTVNAVGSPLDLYRLDGQELVTTSSPAPQHYEPQTFDGSTLTYAAGTNTWTRKKDGWVWTYGSKTGTGSNATKMITDAASITMPVPPNLVCTTLLCRTSTWYLSKAVDPFGNVLTYNYVKQAVPAGLSYAAHEHQPLSILYDNGSRVDFYYGSRKDTRFAVQAGSATVLANRLKEIKVTAGGDVYSRYVIQYEDEKVDTRLGTSLTDCDGNVITVEDLHPKQTLIRKIVRVGKTSATQHTLRCIKSRHETTTWQTGTAGKILDTIVPPTDRNDLPNEIAIPIAANLNFDGVTDVIVIGVGDGDVTAHAYVATPNIARAFASATVGTGAPHDVAVVWDAELAKLDLALFSNHRGWAIADLDGDLIPEVLREKPNGTVVIDRMNFTLTGFTEITTTVNECDLRHGSFADIDGDGHSDLVIRAHGADGNGCNAVVKTKWIRNSGSGTYLDPGQKQTLAVPLEAAVKPLAWNLIMAGVCNGAGVTKSGPWDLDPSWELTPEGYVASNARIADFTGDGIADIAYSLYGCWRHTNLDDPLTTDNESEWETVDNTHYSSVFAGDGQGNFINTKLSAGPAFTFTLADSGSSAVVTDRLLFNVTSPVDTDRDGYPEMLSGRATSEGVEGRFSNYQDLTAGWNLAEEVDAANGTRTDGIFYLSPACNCYLRIGTQAMGDFTGDGMIDIFSLATDTFLPGTPSSTPCPADQWCAVLYKNLRTGSEGRILSSDGPFGGRTNLTWGFSAQAPNDNPSLRFNLEVIQAVDGSEGHVDLTYSGGWTWGRRPTVFAQVERKNARGGVDQLEFITAPWAEGMVSHAARFRTDGTLEHLEVYIRGDLINGVYWLNFAEPYFNPVARHCVYEVGNGSAAHLQTVDVDGLIQRCFDFNGVQEPAPNPDQPGMFHVEMDEVPLVWGHTGGMLTPGSAGAYQATFGATAPQYGSITAAEAWDYALVGDSVFTPPAFLRWPVPPALAGYVPPIQAAEQNYAYPIEGATAVVEFVQDDTWDLAIKQLTSSFDYRDTATEVDDRVHSFFYQQPVASGYWYRLTKHDTRNRSGGLLWTEQHLTFHPTAVYVPLDTKRCGWSLTFCTTDSVAYDAAGNLLSHTFPDGTSEAWTHGACGQVLTHQDQVNRTRTNTVAGCRLKTSTFQRAVTTLTYDELGRVTKAIVSPGGGGAATTLETFYDDAFAHPEDSGFLEPRIGFKRGDGKVVLSYFDGFGRPTKRTECQSGSPLGAGVLGKVGCVLGTMRTAALELYGADGLGKVTVEPFRPGEAPVTHAVGHDGYGRAIVRLDPTHTSTSSGWVTTTHRRSAAWDETVDPQLHVTRTTFSTLLQRTTVDGVFRGSRSFDAKGWLVDETAADGFVLRRLYDALGRTTSLLRLFDTQCIGISLPTNCHWEHEFTSYDAMARPLRELDADNVARDFTYDGIGRVTSVTVDGDLVEERVYNGATGTTNPSVVITDENGAVTTITTDGLGRILSVEGADVARFITWGANGQRSSEVDVNGGTTTYGYDKYDRLTSIVAPGNVTTTLAYTGNNHLLSSTDADGVVISHEYTYAGDLYRTMRDGTRTERTRTYDVLGRPLDVTEAGVRSVYRYDGLGRVDRVERGLGASGAEEVVELAYDTGDRVTARTVTPRIGAAATTRYSYDGWGQLASTTNNANEVWLTQRDILGRVRFVRDPRQIPMETKYDDRGRVTAKQTAGGYEYFSYEPGATYTPFGGAPIPNLSLVKRWDSGDPYDSSGEPLVFEEEYTDSLGRAIATVNRSGTAHVSTWDGSHLVGETWSDGAAVRAQRDHTFDSHERLARSVGPYAPTDAVLVRDSVDYTYTNAGRPASIVTPEETTSFTYASGLLDTETFGDQIHRNFYGNLLAPWVTAEELSSGGSIRRTDYLRDGLGRATKKTTAAPSLPKVVAELSGFNAFGRPTLETRRVDGVLEVSTAWTFDLAGRPATRTVDPLVGTNAVTTWTWQDNGLLAAMTTPSGVQLAYDYGANRLLDRVYDPSGDDHGVVVSRNGRGQPTQIDQPSMGKAQLLTYDDAGRVAVRAITQLSGPDVSVFSNAYDWAGRLVAEELAGSTDTWLTEYAYDGRGRLVEEYRSRTEEVRAYTWSRGGNLLATTLDDGTGPATVMSATYAGQRLTSVNGVNVLANAWGDTTLDQHGNQFTYTADGEIRSITGPGSPTTVQIHRDAAGLPVVELEGGLEPRQIAWDLDPTGVPLEVHQSDGIDRTYISGFGQPLGVLHDGVVTATAANGGATLAHYGDEPVVNDSAFGAGLVPPAGTDERYLFGNLETVKGAVGIHLARHRSYDSETGRFQSRDPIGLRGGPHRYLYAAGDPVGTIDPMGWSCLPDTNVLPSIVMPSISVMAPRYIEGALGGPAEPSAGPLGSFGDQDIGDDDDASDESGDGGDNGETEDDDGTGGIEIPSTDEPVGGGLATTGLEANDAYADAGDAGETPSASEETDIVYVADFTGEENPEDIKQAFLEKANINVLGDVHWDAEAKVWWTSEFEYVGNGGTDAPSDTGNVGGSGEAPSDEGAPLVVTGRAGDHPGGGSTEIDGTMADVASAGGGTAERYTPYDFHDGPIARSSPLEVLQYLPVQQGMGMLVGAGLSGTQDWLEGQYWWPGQRVFPDWWLDTTGYTLFGLGPIGPFIASYNGWTNDDLIAWFADPVNQGELSVLGELVTVGGLASSAPTTANSAAQSGMRGGSRASRRPAGAQWVSNGNGGRNLLTTGKRNGPQIHEHIDAALAEGHDVVVLSGTHGSDTGKIGIDPAIAPEPGRSTKLVSEQFLGEDYTKYLGNPKVTIVDVTKMSNADIEQVLGWHNGNVACAWCDSSTSTVVINALRNAQ